MPLVNGKKYPYTAAGKKAAAVAMKKKKKAPRAQAASNILNKMKKY